MNKTILSGIKAREKIRSGVNQLADAVGQTLGPRARTVALERQWGFPLVVDDGVTIAKEIDLKDSFENVGAQLIKDAAQKTVDRAGDGTTTSILLAQAMINEGLKIVSTGVSPMMIRRGMEQALPLVVKALAKQAKKVKTLRQKIQIASIAATDDELGKTIAETVDKVGVEGVVTVEEGHGLETKVEYKQGMEIDAGFVSPYFITNPARQIAEIDNPYILLTNYSLMSVADVLPFFKRFSQEAKTKALVVVAEKVEGSVLASMVVTKLQGMVSLTAVQMPGVGENKNESLQDLADLTGATIISKESGRSLDEIEMKDLGQCSKIIQDKKSTIFQEGAGDPARRIESIKEQIKDAKTDYVRERLEERLAKLSSGIAIIRVGAPTSPEMKERKERVIDAVNATKAAIEEGYVIGGALALIRAQEALEELSLSDEEMAGVKIIRHALGYPFRKLLENAGQDAGRILNQIETSKEEGVGYNVMTDKIEDLFKAGVIDPAKVVRLAFENAVSVAIVVLTTNVVVCIEKEEGKENKREIPRPPMRP